MEVKPTNLIKREQPAKPQEIAGGYDARIMPPELLPDDCKHYQLIDFFFLEPAEYKEQDSKLKEISNWARKTSKSEKREDSIRELVHLENNLGRRPVGVSRIDHLYHYVKLTNAIDLLDQQRTNLISGG